MNATPPEAKTEYSRGFEHSESGFRRLDRSRDSAAAHGARERPRTAPPAAPRGARLVRGAILIGGLLGALLLLVAEFTTLFEIRTSAGGSAVQVGRAPARITPTRSSRSRCSWSCFSIAVWTAVSRPALLAIGDARRARAADRAARRSARRPRERSGRGRRPALRGRELDAERRASTWRRSAAVVLLITSVCGFLLIGPPPRSGRRRSAPGSTDA